MRRAREHHHHASTCLPVRLHATITYTPSLSTHPSSSSSSKWSSDLRALGLPPPLHKYLYASQDEEGVVEAVWHTWADSDLTGTLVGKFRAVREGDMSKVGVESVVLHRLRKDLTVPLSGATPLARVSVHAHSAPPPPSATKLPVPEVVTVTPSTSSSSSSSSTTSTPFTSPSPAPESLTPVASDSGSGGSCGDTENDSDEDLELLYPDTDSECEGEDQDQDEKMECELETVQPMKPLADYPLSPVSSEPDTPQLHSFPPSLTDGTPQDSWTALETEIARLRAELQSARHEAETHKQCASFLEQDLRHAQGQLAINQQCAPHLLEALLRVNTTADETMREDA